jgi:hypothetical protein
VAEECQVKTPDPPPVTAERLRGWKQLQRVAGLLTKLHAVGCDRDKAGNRELHFDDYVLLILLYLERKTGQVRLFRAAEFAAK